MENKKSLTLEDLKGKSAEWLLDWINERYWNSEGCLVGNIFTAYRYKGLPRTYDKCCEFIGLSKLELPIASGFMSIEIESFQKLLVCRQAFLNFIQTLPKQRYCLSYITHSKDNIVIREFHKAFGEEPLLCFPTELCEIFYDNFKEIIEQCKEFI